MSDITPTPTSGRRRVFAEEARKVAEEIIDSPPAQPRSALAAADFDEEAVVEVVDLGASKQFEDDPNLIDPEPAPPPVEPPKQSLRDANTRPNLRPQRPNDVDHRERAAKRAAELRGHFDTDMEGPDEFYVDPASIPPGWSYEWKRHTVYNAEDPSYQVALASKGWEAVPASRHPEMMPLGYRGEVIERKGMILMERPREITEERKAFERRKAAAQVRQKEAQLAQAGQGQFERSNKGTSLVNVGRAYEALPIPE